MPVLDGHVHCGLSLRFETIESRWREGGIDGGVLFSPVEEIYDRYDYLFTDTPAYQESREKVHTYLESLLQENIYAFWFVWNDFVLPRQPFCGIKWHRHASEPVYNYSAPGCEAFISHICERRLPVILEEEFHHTLEFVDRIAGRTPIIIPHCGGLNGGYTRLKKAGLFEHETVYIDTALGSTREISDFAGEYGVERVIFGSDFPFGEPAWELAKVNELFQGQQLKKVQSENLLALLSAVKPVSGS